MLVSLSYYANSVLRVLQGLDNLELVVTYAILIK